MMKPGIGNIWTVKAIAMVVAITFGIGSQDAIASEVTSDITDSALESLLPPPDDLPEEIARTQIIIEARSPVDGRPLSASEYAELQIQLEAANRSPQLRREIRQIIFLLEFRRGIYDLFPFLPE